MALKRDREKDIATLTNHLKDNYFDEWRSMQIKIGKADFMYPKKINGYSEHLTGVATLLGIKETKKVELKNDDGEKTGEKVNDTCYSNEVVDYIDELLDDVMQTETNYTKSA